MRISAHAVYGGYIITRRNWFGLRLYLTKTLGWSWREDHAHTIEDARNAKTILAFMRDLF